MARLSLAVAFLCLALALSLPAAWVEADAQVQPSTGGLVTHRHAEMEDSETGERATLDLAIFSAKSCALRVIDNGEQRSDLAQVMRDSNGLAAVNGGYFDPEFRPLGLRIVDGKTISPLLRGRLMSGVIGSNGSVQLLRVAEFSRSKKLNAALECGPMLVDGGKPVRGLEASRAARRSFAAVDGRGRAALGSCSDVTLAQLGGVLLAKFGDFKIQRALNFDGGSSSAFWFKRANGSAFLISEEKTVRDFIAVVPR